MKPSLLGITVPTVSNELVDPTATVYNVTAWTSNAEFDNIDINNPYVNLADIAELAGAVLFVETKICDKWIPMQPQIVTGTEGYLCSYIPNRVRLLGPFSAIRLNAITIPDGVTLWAEIISTTPDPVPPTL